MQNQLLKAFELIMNKIGLASSQILPEYVKYYYASAWAWMACSVLIMLILLVTGISIYGIDSRRLRLNNKYCKDNDEMSSKTLGALVIIVGLFIFLFTLSTNVPTVLAPRAVSIQALLQDVKLLK